MESLAPRFQEYFSRPVAEKAAKSLSDGAQIEIRVNTPDGVGLETLTFTRRDKKNHLLAQGADSPEVIFTVTLQAAEEILSDRSDDVGAIGVRIGKLIVSRDPTRRVTVRLKAGFLTLFTKGYFGVITAGGASFASFLASNGLQGLDALKSAVKKMKGQ